MDDVKIALDGRIVIYPVIKYIFMGKYYNILIFTPYIKNINDFRYIHTKNIIGSGVDLCNFHEIK
jgi:hypothetical protein